ncbi:MAG: ATP-binding cassette domain-containing protein [Actinobacteria bacterium]|nr:ATP-binding cassette domain-containing protein [Actinomycetota bacterium]
MAGIIEVSALERSFKGPDGAPLAAVDGVDLRVEDGEVYGFLGPNGAGKTTLVRMLVTLLRPTAGSARVAGHDIVREAAAVRSAIGVTLQDAALDPLMTGFELLSLQASLHGLRKRAAADKAEELLERVDLTFAGPQRVGTYSGGMRRRLDLAMSLIHEPGVLFLDEPTTGLDPISRKVLWDEVRRLNAAGTTVFLTTQYLEEADELADRVGIIARGKIVAEGTPAELKAQAGASKLEVTIHDPDQLATARELLSARRSLLAPRSGVSLCLRLEPGESALAPYVVALDQAGVTVDRIDLVEPSLDDVFLMQTGHHFPSDGDEPAAADAAVAE